MMKKAVFALLLALALTSVTPIASADIDIPGCDGSGCDTK